MRHPSERRWPGILVGYAILIGALAGVDTIAYLSVSDVNKELVIRIAIAVLVGVAILHVHARLRLWVEDQPRNFELMLRPEMRSGKIDPLFLQLRNEVKYSVKSRRYFDRVLWPRLVKLGGAGGNTKPLERPPERWIGRLGPSLRTVVTLITLLGDKP